MKDGFYFENERKAKEAEFYKLLNLFLPTILGEQIRKNKAGITKIIASEIKKYD